MRALLLSTSLVSCSTAQAPLTATTATTTTTPAEAPSSIVTRELVVDVTHVKLFVRAVGGPTANRTIVAIHGGPGISHEYMRAFEVLASGSVRVVTYDQRGVGRSTRPADDTAYTFAHQAHDLEMVRARLGARSLDLVAHSYGGPLAMQYAILYPQRVRSLLLVDSAPPRGGDWNQAQFFMGGLIKNLQADGVLPERFPEIGDDDDCTANLVALLPAYFYDRKHPMTKHLAGSKCTASVGYLTSTSNDQPYDLSEGVATLAMPTLVIHGVADPFGTHIAELTAKAFARAEPRLEILERCGHIPFEECPDRFFPLVRAFLETSSP